MKRSVVILAALLTLAAGSGWAGMPNTTKEFSGVTIEQVTDLLERALEGRRFQVMDIDRDEEGEVTIQAHRENPYAGWFAGQSNMMNFYRLRVTSNGRVRATCVVTGMAANNEWNRHVWDDLEAAVVAAGGTAYCFGKGGKESLCKAGGGNHPAPTPAPTPTATPVESTPS